MATRNTALGAMKIKMNNDGESAVVSVEELGGDTFEVRGDVMQLVLHAPTGDDALRLAVSDAVARCLDDPAQDDKDLLRYNDYLEALSKARPRPEGQTLADFFGDSD